MPSGRSRSSPPCPPPHHRTAGPGRRGHDPAAAGLPEAHPGDLHAEQYPDDRRRGGDGLRQDGTLFACEQEKVVPDIMALAKGITGGYLPLAATLTTEEIYAAFKGEQRDLRTFFHGHTYTGNRLPALPPRRTSISSGRRRRSSGSSPRSSSWRRTGGTEKAPHVGEVRQKGFMVGIELVKNRLTKEPYLIDDKIGSRWSWNAARRGSSSGRSATSSCSCRRSRCPRRN